jgi:hypothetical protein
MDVLREIKIQFAGGRQIWLLRRISGVFYLPVFQRQSPVAKESGLGLQKAKPASF